MQNFINLIYYIFFGINIFTALTGLYLSRRFPPSGRILCIQVLGMTIFFCLLDLFLLNGLVWLKQSFGPFQSPFLVLMCARLCLFFLWIISWRFSYQFNKTKPEGKSIIQGWQICLLINLFVSLTTVYAFYVEPFSLSTSQRTIETKKLPKGSQLRIVQISDLHVERLTRREYAVIRQVNALNPDVIVITGDYPNLSFIDDQLTWDQIHYMVSHLKALHGVFLINGSNETSNQVRELTADSGAVALTDIVYPLDWEGGRLYLMGVNDDHSYFGNYWPTHLRDLMDGIPQESFVIMLHHSPDLIKTAAPLGVDLYLAGHTHGGQIRLPIFGAVFTSSIYNKEFEMGFYQFGPTSLYVNRGLGMEGWEAPRARFLAPPEIAVFDIKGIGENVTRSGV